MRGFLLSPAVLSSRRGAVPFSDGLHGYGGHDPDGRHGLSLALLLVSSFVGLQLRPGRSSINASTPSAATGLWGGGWLSHSAITFGSRPRPPWTSRAFSVVHMVCGRLRPSRARRFPRPADRHVRPRRNPALFPAAQRPMGRARTFHLFISPSGWGFWFKPSSPLSATTLVLPDCPSTRCWPPAAGAFVPTSTCALSSARPTSAMNGQRQASRGWSPSRRPCAFVNGRRPPSSIGARRVHARASVVRFFIERR